MRGKKARQIRTVRAEGWKLEGGLIEELRAACLSSPLVVARLKGFIQGKGGGDKPFELLLEARLVPGNPAAKKPA